MSPVGPPAAVRRHVIAPLFWVVPLVVIAVLFFVADSRYVRSAEAGFDGGQTADAEIEHVTGSRAKASYRNVDTDQVVETDLQLRGRDVEGGDTVRVVVSRVDPDDIRLVDRPYETPRLFRYLWLPLLPLLWVALRAFARDRTRRLMRARGPAFEMLAVVGPAPAWSRRCLLHLYALDSRRASAPVCSVPLLDTAGLPVGRLLRVEVKGVPRPLGRVVARVGDDVLWPASRALLTAKAPRPAEVKVPVRVADDHPVEVVVDRTAPFVRTAAVDLIVLAAAVGLGVFVSLNVVVNGRAAARLYQEGTQTIGEVVEGDDIDVRFVYRLPGKDQARGDAPAVGHYEKGRKYPIVVGDNGDVRLLAEPYDAMAPLVCGWLPAAPALAVVLRRALWRRRATALLQRATVWRPVEVRRLGDRWTTRQLGLGADAAPHACMAYVGRMAASARTPLPDEPGTVVHGAVAGRAAPGEAIVLAVRGLVIPLDRPAGAPHPETLDKWPPPTERGEELAYRHPMGLFAWSVILAVVGVVAGLVASAVGVPDDGALAVVGGVLGVVRALTMVLRADDDGLFVRNPFTTRRIPWPEVDGLRLVSAFEYRHDVEVVVVDRVRGRRVVARAAVVAMEGRRGQRANDFVDTLRRIAHTNGADGVRL